MSLFFTGVAAMAKLNVIQTRGLTKTFGEVTALRDLNLTVPEHSIFGFLGPNGAGKTTTIKLLLGLLKPTSGSGQIFDRDIVNESLEIRTRIGYLPQEPRYYEHMTAREVLQFTLRFFYQGPENEIRNRIDEVLTLVDLQDKADRPIKGFSGGERQRLGIAQAQINYPDLLILDEPAASLDPIGRHDVLKIMERLQKYTTIFYSTHILDDVQRVSDTVAILNHGELVAQGPIETLLAGSEGVVYTVGLKDAGENTLGRIKALGYVKDILVKEKEGLTQWHVEVTDDEAAEANLLRAIMEDPVIVTAYQKRQYDLEDIFISIVEGDNHGR
jgi:ABC-2 type transport system ATP-binding protein